MVLRAKTIDLLQTKDLTDQQKANSDQNLKEIKGGSQFLLSFPRRLVLELTNACNIKCIMCGRDEANFNKTVLDLSSLEELDEALKLAEEVTLFGWGEPTIHPKFDEILEQLHHYPVRKYFVTNGTRLKNIKNTLFEYRVDIMAVSLDGASPETNDKIRVGSSFDQIVSGLSDIVKEKKRYGLDFPYINFVFTAMRSNLHELPDMVRLAYELGIEEVKVVYLTVFSHKLLNESLWGHQEEVRGIFAESIRLAESLGVKIKLPYMQGEDIAGDKPHKDCFVGWRDFFLGSDGYVRPCQSSPIKLFPYSKYGSFEKMWNSVEYQDFRYRINNPDTMPEGCKRCYQSSHANWNRKSSYVQIDQQFAPDWEKKTNRKVA